MNHFIEFYDTTLRDGLQGWGVHLTLNQKLDVIQILDEFGIDMIEAGWNGANPIDTQLFEKSIHLNLQNAKLAAFCSTINHHKSLKTDTIFQHGTAVETPAITLFGKTWDFQVTTGVYSNLEHNLKVIYDSIAYVRSRFDRVIFDAEHFFDGYLSNPEYAIQTLKIACEAGADTLVFCDTNGGTLPHQIQKILSELLPQFPGVRTGIHCHNDTGVAVANSLIAAGSGTNHIQGTFNGVGERCGNANLCTLIPNLIFKSGRESRNITTKQLFNLTSVANQIADMMKKPVANSAPFVGKNAFSHKGGVHIASIKKDARCYEHIQPEMVGNVSQLVLSNQSGKASVKLKLSELGYYQVEDRAIYHLLALIKHKSTSGHYYDDCEASLNLLIHQELNPSARWINISHFGSSIFELSEHERYHRLEFAIYFGERAFFRRLLCDKNVIPDLEEALVKIVQEYVPAFRPSAIEEIECKQHDDQFRCLVRSKRSKYIFMGLGRSQQEACCMAIIDCYNHILFDQYLVKERENAIA